MKLPRLLHALIILYTASCAGEGFVAGTLVKTLYGYVPIEQLEVGDRVICYDFQGECTDRPIKDIKQTSSNDIITFAIGSIIIEADSDHKFYLPHLKRWVVASDLRWNDTLLANCGTNTKVRWAMPNFIDKPVDVYDISVEKFHNFCVSTLDIHAHNFFPLIALGVTWTIGEGVAFAGGIGIGSFILGTMLYQSSQNARSRSFDRLEHETQFIYTDRAPGQPTEAEGYRPPKNWDGEKVRHPKTGQYGYPDSKGCVWVPSGVEGHRGPHWDVIDRSGKHENVLPGGERC